MKIVVTGSSGTIGTRLCEKLLEKGHDVIGVDCRHNKWNKQVDKITIIADLRDKSSLKKLPKDAELVIHLAANARVYDLVIDPDMARDNLMTAYNALEYARLNKIKRFMFASSRETYGNISAGKLSEDDADFKNCESPYSASKIAGEALARAYGRCYGIDFIIFRFSNVYGMYDESDRVVPLFIRMCKQGKDLTVFGKDKMLDFTYIDDTITGINLAIENFDRAKNEVYNIAFGEGTTILWLAQEMKRLLKAKINISLSSNRTGEVVTYVADISKAKKALGYSPTISIGEGLKRSIQWYEKSIK